MLPISAMHRIFKLNRFIKLTICLVICFYMIIVSLSYDENTNDYSAQRQPHLFDNLCKFVWTEPFDTTLKSKLTFKKKVSCETVNPNLFKRAPDTGIFTFIEKTSTRCVINEIGGSLRPKTSDFKVKSALKVNFNFGDKFWINANNFIIKCYDSSNHTMYKNGFMGFKLLSSSKILQYGKLPKIEATKLENEKYSLSMLVLDSTSRAQYQRHMKKTKDLMKDMGFVTFQAYNKVGDNSAVNMLPILAEQLEETREYPLLDNVSDINIAKILPYKTLNPENIQWVWKKLPKFYKTMFNDDIMHTYRGLFHYPPQNFEKGFYKAPANYYFRPFYIYLYKSFNNFWKICYDNKLLAIDFLDSWFRFEKIFSHVPHFGLTFISSLTHDNPNNLNLLDETLYERLNNLRVNGNLENTFLIIQGDHGNRIHPLHKYTFAGKIEERAPLLSIYVPNKYRLSFPENYKNLQDNAQTFISNFDLHETILNMLNITERSKPKRGKTLFEPHEIGKTCSENNVSKNFCLCMEEKKREDDDNLPYSDYIEQITKYLKEYNLTSCIKTENLQCNIKGNHLIYMPNDQVQLSSRRKMQQSDIEEKRHRLNYQIYYKYIKCSIATSNNHNIKTLIKFRVNRNTKKPSIRIVYHPKILEHNYSCGYYTFLRDFCNCMKHTS